MLKIVTLVGARPQFIKAAAISRVLKEKFSNQVHEVLVHSGQHYDDKMSEVFFEELEIPKPKYNLSVGSKSHAAQTGEIMMALEPIVISEKPDVVILFGDTNTTLAGALVASKLNIKIAHIESGLRSFNMQMPEEINRVITDELSTFLFCPTQESVKNLESLKSLPHMPVVLNCGDVMYDTSLYYRRKATDTFTTTLGFAKDEFVLATIHRDFNTDNKSRLEEILNTLNQLAEKKAIVLPLHPRTIAKMESFNIPSPKNIKIIPPVSYLEMLSLEANAQFIITDSGGVQKEAFFFRKPSLILREETEWTEIVENGNALLCGASSFKIKQGFEHLLSEPFLDYPDFYGNGKSAEIICAKIVEELLD